MCSIAGVINGEKGDINKLINSMSQIQMKMESSSSKYFNWYGKIKNN